MSTPNPLATPAPQAPQPSTTDNAENSPAQADDTVSELGGPKGPEPTRFGDWERGGRCSDF